MQIESIWGEIEREKFVGESGGKVSLVACITPSVAMSHSVIYSVRDAITYVLGAEVQRSDSTNNGYNGNNSSSNSSPLCVVTP